MYSDSANAKLDISVGSARRLRRREPASVDGLRGCAADAGGSERTTNHVRCSSRTAERHALDLALRTERRRIARQAAKTRGRVTGDRARSTAISWRGDPGIRQWREAAHGGADRYAADFHRIGISRGRPPATRGAEPIHCTRPSSTRFPMSPRRVRRAGQRCLDDYNDAVLRRVYLSIDAQGTRKATRSAISRPRSTSNLTVSSRDGDAGADGGKTRDGHRISRGGYDPAGPRAARSRALGGPARFTAAARAFRNRQQRHPEAARRPARAPFAGRRREPARPR